VFNKLPKYLKEESDNPKKNETESKKLSEYQNVLFIARIP